MCEEFAQTLSKLAISFLCREMGCHYMEEGALELLTDVMQKYIKKIGNVTSQYSELSGRNSVNYLDLRNALVQFNISTSQLEYFATKIRELSLGKTISNFPIEKRSNINKISRKRFLELRKRAKQQGWQEQVEEESMSSEEDTSGFVFDFQTQSLVKSDLIDSIDDLEFETNNNNVKQNEGFNQSFDFNSASLQSETQNENFPRVPKKSLVTEDKKQQGWVKLNNPQSKSEKILQENQLNFQLNTNTSINNTKILIDIKKDEKQNTENEKQPEQGQNQEPNSDFIENN
ncbi:transcription initiation factor tfiid subunit 3 [Anaeramoeba flamelloides]|uniref:Transcription initiation factor tfiid subunit 3 n=1 Tax=Anaeramoeba flamelloides TaxID=1746091 RepID=A0ABQ8XCA4_9EUKA|nr:transcription initiation factor tfiid subunit 3 [Anaeramoeba flamelloides]